LAAATFLIDFPEGAGTAFEEVLDAVAFFVTDLVAEFFTPARAGRAFVDDLVPPLLVFARDPVTGTRLQSRKTAQRCRSWRVHPTV